MSIAFVLDASMACAWVLPNQASPEADTLMDRIAAGAGAVVPPLWFLEVANGLLAAQRRRLITGGERALALDRLSDLAIAVDDSDARRAFSRTSTLAEQHGLTVYDATYLELALRSNLPLGTRDRALRAAAKRSGIPPLT